MNIIQWWTCLTINTKKKKSIFKIYEDRSRAEKKNNEKNSENQSSRNKVARGGETNPNKFL